MSDQPQSVTYDQYKAVMDRQANPVDLKVSLEELWKYAAEREKEFSAIEEKAGLREPEDDGEKRSKRKDTRYRKCKITPHVLLYHFKKTVYYVNIEGALHLFDFSLNYYTPVSKQELIAFLSYRYSVAEEYENSPTLIKRCADLFVRERINEVVPAHKNMILCLQDGYVRLDDPEKISFTRYNINFNPYPTYHILANGGSDINIADISKERSTPNMDKFLNIAGNGIPKFAERVWEMIGYLIVPDYNGKCLFLLQGRPNSGKSVLGNFIEALFPPSKLSSLDVDQLGKPHANSALVNKCLNTSMDLPNKSLSTSAIRTLKLITGNDDLTVAYKNYTFERHQLTCKFLFATNHALTLRGVDSALEDRIVCIPFTSSISPEDRDPDLLSKLLSEKNNIVAKAFAYYWNLRNRNYIFSGTEYRDQYKPHIRYLPNEAEDLDAGLCYFVESCCSFVSQEEGIHAEILYQEYRKFCKDYNETPISTQAAFSRRLQRCYSDKITKAKWRKAKDDSPQWGFKGILLNPLIKVKAQ